MDSLVRSTDPVSRSRRGADAASYSGRSPSAASSPRSISILGMSDMVRSTVPDSLDASAEPPSFSGEAHRSSYLGSTGSLDPPVVGRPAGVMGSGAGGRGARGTFGEDLGGGVARGIDRRLELAGHAEEPRLHLLQLQDELLPTGGQPGE